MTYAKRWLLGAGIACQLLWIACGEPAGDTVLTSPDGMVTLAFELKSVGDAESCPVYSVRYRGKEVLSSSGLGMRFEEQGTFWNRVTVTGISRTKRNETYRMISGKAWEVRNRYHEMSVRLRDDAGRRVDVVFRTFDDGVAFRYVIPEQASMGGFSILDELTDFRFAADPTAFYLGFREYENSHENDYRIRRLSEIGPGEVHIDLPILMQCPDSVWAAITEAQLIDYAGMYLRKTDSLTLACDLTPRLDAPEIKVRGNAPFRSPWRVIMLGDDPGKLIESNIVVNLNDPCALEDTSWIRPGRTTWHWWNGTAARNVAFKPGMNTETMKHYIDFSAANGVEYHALVDQAGLGWYGRSRGDISANDMTKAIPEIDLPAVLSYAKEKGVGIRLWLHWANVKRQMEEAFPLYETWGINGFMMDFMDRSDQEMVNFCNEVLKQAAKHRMTVQFHGAYKPTGLQRTYPNLMNREGALNLEYLKWSDRCTPEHNLIVPFTRMLAGPMDYHLGGFRSVTEEEFHRKKNNMIEPEVMGTRCHHLAMYVVYENTLPMVCDFPEAYANQAGFEFVQRIPVAWDETRVIRAEVGNYIAVAKRKGREWYLGIMTDWTGRSLAIPLTFLSGGKYRARIYSDAPDSDRFPNHLTYTERFLEAGDTLEAVLSPGGGQAVRIIPTDAN